MINVGVAILAMAGLVFAGANEPNVKVEVKGMHLCCGGCEGGAKGAVEGGGAKEASTDKASGTLTFSVANDAAAVKALEKLAAAGFWGTIDSKTIALKDDSGTVLGPKAKPVQVSSGTFKGAHNCCDGCNKALKEAIKGVEGVESEDCKAKEATFTVKGKFDPAAVIKAIHGAGYHAKLDKADVIKPGK